MINELQLLLEWNRIECWKFHSVANGSKIYSMNNWKSSKLLIYLTSRMELVRNTNSDWQFDIYFNWRFYQVRFYLIGNLHSYIQRHLWIIWKTLIISFAIQLTWLWAQNCLWEYKLFVFVIECNFQEENRTCSSNDIYNSQNQSNCVSSNY